MLVKQQTQGHAARDFLRNWMGLTVRLSREAEGLALRT
jgi:hypothetical protein